MNLLDSILVFDTEYKKVRIGDKKDGGYVLLDNISHQTEILYSYGVETNSSFEDEFCKKYNCRAILFDHTVDKPAEDNNDFLFVKEGLSHIKKENFDTLENHLNRYSNPIHKTLKMDVEWSEWDVFDTMSDNVLSGFDQILCEFHMIPVKYLDKHSPYFTGFHQCVYHGINDILKEKYSRVLNKVQENYYIYHVHINNSIPCVDFNGEEVPPLLEVSMVNKNLVKDPRYTIQDFPVDGLDFPNKTDRPDITHIKWNK